MYFIGSLQQGTPSRRRARRGPRQVVVRPGLESTIRLTPYVSICQGRLFGCMVQHLHAETGGVAVKKLLLALWVISLLVPAVASAQPFPVNAAGVTNGHWHLNSRDIEASKKIFVAMGGTAIKTGNFEIV